MQYLRDKEFRMIVLISACVAAISAAAGLFLMGRGAYTAAILPPVCRFCGSPSRCAATAVWKSWPRTRIGCFTESGI